MERVARGLMITPEPVIVTCSMRLAPLLLLFFNFFALQAQSILHFTRTSGYDHNTRNESFGMFTAICAQIGASLVNDATGDQFSDLSSLLQFDVIVFSNTSGDAILDAQQRQNFETYIANGGNVLGIHAASDTYRRSTANGNNTGTWDFYAELIGASVQEGPNHVNGTPEYAMHHIGMHTSTSSLPDPWVKNEEYYYWENGFLGSENEVVLEVEETVGPNGMVNSYDAPRPMSWHRTVPNGTKVFYTALGHATSNFNDDDNFRAHITDALVWLLDGTTGAQELGENSTFIFPNPANGTISVRTDTDGVPTLLAVMDAFGRIVHRQRVAAFPYVLDVHAFSPGPYTISIEGLPNTRFTIMR